LQSVRLRPVLRSRRLADDTIAGATSLTLAIATLMDQEKQ